VAQATIGQIAAAAARGNEFKSSGWIAFLAKTVLVVGLLIFALGAFLLPWVGETIYEDRRIGVWAWWLCAQPLLELPRIVAMVAFQGTRRMLLLGQTENGHELVRFFLVVCGALVTGSAEGAVLGQLLASAIGSVLALGLYRQARRDGGHPLPGLRQIAARMRDVKIRQGIRLGLRVGLLKNGQTLFGNVFPRLIIGAVADMSWVTYFHIAQRVVMVPMMLAQGVSRTLLPALGELAGLKDLRRFRRLFFRATLLTGGCITAGILIALPLIRPLTRILFPADYADPVLQFALILSLGYVPFSFAVGLESFYIVSNQVRAWLGLTVVGALITIPTNVWLILAVPYTGTAWGLSLYHSWVIVHLGYAAWFLLKSQARRQVWSDPEGSGDGSDAAGGGLVAERAGERGS
jgi:O-antigen/teichoic acid export membrane protein